MSVFGWILLLLALQRISELVIARGNTARLLALGAHEVGASHYPLFILLHVSWFAALIWSIEWNAQPFWPLIFFLLFLQLLRLWVIRTLGRFWTTRIITLDGAPLTRSGPYRFLRHPNYWIVVCEIAALPLAFGAWRVALIWSLMNATLLLYRVHVEDAALAPRDKI